MDIDQIQQVVEQEMQAVDSAIEANLQSDIELINEIGAYIIEGGGKRLRPMLLILAAKSCGDINDNHINAAAIIEFIHTATLLHDDVIDMSAMRRGRDTANTLWGDQAAVLVGDFLYSRAFQMMVKIGDMRVMQILADATNTIAEGEVLQLMNCKNIDVSIDSCFEVIKRKTAKLFQAAGELGALLGNATKEKQQAMADYGMHLGIAFQLIDDVLDYSASEDDLGKRIGDDIAEGKVTLPLVYALEECTPENRLVITQAIEGEPNEADIATVAKIVKGSNAILTTKAMAQEQIQLAKKALEIIEDSEAKKVLDLVADFALVRSK